MKQKQRQTQIVNVHVGAVPKKQRKARARRQKRQPKEARAPMYAFNPPPIINFPPGFNQTTQPNSWATPPPPIQQRPRAAFVEGEVAELLNQSKTEPVRLTFEGSLADRLREPARVAPLAEYTAPTPFEPPHEVAFNEPDFTEEEIARNEAALAKEARAVELAAEEDARVEAAANLRVAAELEKTKAAVAAVERGAAAAAALPFAAEAVLPVSAEELVKPIKPKKKDYVAEGPIISPADRDQRYRYNREGRQKFTLSGKPITKQSKEVEEPLGFTAGAVPPNWALRAEGPSDFVAPNALPPLVAVRGSESLNREPLRFLGESTVPPERPSGLERQRREDFLGRSGPGSVLSGAEETLLSGSAVSGNWPY